MHRKLGLGLGIVLLSVGAAYYIFSYELTSKRSEAFFEIFKFLLFTCAVSGVLLLYKSIEVHQSVRKAERRAVETFRQDFLAAYHNLKMVRREFRFLTHIDDGKLFIVDRPRFADCYRILNDAYVDFELLRKSISSASGIFAKIEAQISSDMRAVDQYIRKIMLELENMDWANESSFDLSKVERFHAFLYTDGNPVHVAASKSLDRFLSRVTSS